MYVVLWRVGDRDLTPPPYWRRSAAQRRLAREVAVLGVFAAAAVITRGG